MYLAQRALVLTAQSDEDKKHHSSGDETSSPSFQLGLIVNNLRCALVILAETVPTSLCVVTVLKMTARWTGETVLDENNSSDSKENNKTAR